jgi:hypothetical protein
MGRLGLRLSDTMQSMLMLHVLKLLQLHREIDAHSTIAHVTATVTIITGLRQMRYRWDGWYMGEDLCVSSCGSCSPNCTQPWKLTA